MAKLSQYLNVDLSSFPLDEQLDVNAIGKSDNSIHAMINMLKRFDGQFISPRILGEKMAFCGFGPMPVGTPEMVADVMEDWVNNGDIDGFNVACKKSRLRNQKSTLTSFQMYPTLNPTRILSSFLCPSYRSVV